jgi:4-amino-4-deoxy-L-arabinose transferase-like glycosyltransferase
MPYDGTSVGVIVLSAALLFGASRSNVHITIRLGCVLLAALLVRTDAAWHFNLNQWDERYHALVAKNLIARPFVPTLYRDAPIPYDYRDWMTNHVWLHKPPGALWPMAASMALFGVNEIAMRLPSIILATLSVWLTFLIGAELAGAPAGLMASAFHAINGFLVALASGRRVADHVDTALIFWIELGVWCAIVHARRRDAWSLAATGLALGAALLTKSLPALLLAAVAFSVFIEREPFVRAARRAATVLVIGAAIWAPWMIYVHLEFPREAEWSSQYMVRHLVRPLEGHDAAASIYVRDMPKYFGELVWIPIAAFLVAVVREHRLRGVAAWLLITYVAFSAARTRMSAFVMIAAPAVFLIQADFWHRLREWSRGMTGLRRALSGMLLAGLLVLPGRYLLDPANVFERRDRSSEEFNRLRRLDHVLKVPGGVIFNSPMPIETMFYSRFLAYRQLPTGEQVRELKAKGIPIVIYVSEGMPWIPPEWDVIMLRPSELN